MGTPTDMLVAVTTMHDNPQGLTKEEAIGIFQNKLDLNPNYDGIYSYLKFGLYGFASLFNLDKTEEYKKKS